MTPVSIRITTTTRKQLETTMCRAFRAGDLPLVKRVTALRGIARGEPVEVVAGSGRESVERARVAARLPAGGGGRTARALARRPAAEADQDPGTAAGGDHRGRPEAAGFPTGCWHALLIQQVIQREFGVTDNVHSLATLLHTLSFSFQKARFVSDHLDELARAARLVSTFPAWRAQAEAADGLLLFGDEGSFAQWGSLGYTWAPIGQQPVVRTTGRRKTYKVFGLIELFSGRVFYQRTDGRFNGDSYVAFLSWVLEQTTEPLFLVQDGAP